MSNDLTQMINNLNALARADSREAYESFVSELQRLREVLASIELSAILIDYYDLPTVFICALSDVERMHQIENEKHQKAALDFSKAITLLQTSAGQSSENIASLSEEILKLAESENE